MACYMILWALEPQNSITFNDIMTLIDTSKTGWQAKMASVVEIAKAQSNSSKIDELTKLTLWEHEGMLVVSGRATQGLKHYFGVDYLPVLMSNTRVAELIALWAHEQDHANRDVTFATTMQLVWLVGGRDLCGKIKDSCIRCRFLQKNLVGQKMANLPRQLTVPCPPFTNVGLDLFGPMEVTIMGGSRTTRRRHKNIIQKR